MWSGNFESTQARNGVRESSVRETFLVNLVHKVATSGYFEGYPSFLQI